MASIESQLWSSNRREGVLDYSSPQHRQQLGEKTDAPVKPTEKQLVDEGECSDSDALLPSSKCRALSDDRPLTDILEDPTSIRKRRSSTDTDLDHMESFLEEGEPTSPLLRCRERVSGSSIENQTKSQSIDYDREGKKGEKGLSICETGCDKQWASEPTFVPSENHPLSAENPFQGASSFHQTRRQHHSQNAVIIRSIPPISASSAISHRRRRNRRSSSFGEEGDLASTSNSSSNSSIAAANIGTRSSSSVPPINGKLFLGSLDSGMSALQRWIQTRSRAPRRNTSTTASTASNNTSSLGEEDLFALSMNGEDPRALGSQDAANVIQPQPPYSTSRLFASDNNFPPVVWEEDASVPYGMEMGPRRRTFSEPNENRIRDFLFQRALATPGLRSRTSGRTRQSRSVQQEFSRASSSRSPSGALSSSAAAVLFTSSRSDDSLQHPLFNRQSSQATSVPPSSTSVGSTTAVGMADRSIRSVDAAVNVDTRSPSTVGTSSYGPTVVNNDSSRRGPDAPAAQESLLTAAEVDNGNTPDGDGGVEGGGNSEVDNAGREARVRWVQINQRFQLMVTAVALLFSLLLFSILISWIVLTSAYVVTFDKVCDVPLKSFYWLVTLQMVLDVFRQDIMRYILRWDPQDPSAHPALSNRTIPPRVMLYNLCYLAYALLVLRMGINAVYVDGQRDSSSCRHTSPELFQASFVFVTLTLAAWTTIILGYLVPFCFVASLLTLNGYNPGEANPGGLAPGVFPGAYSNNGAPPGCVDQLREVDHEVEENMPTECCICMEDFGTGRNADDVVVATDCNHLFHRNCMAVWLNQARTCPVCRTDVADAQEQRHQEDGGEGSGRSQQEANYQSSETRQTIPQRAQRRRARGFRQANLSPGIPFIAGGQNDVARLFRAIRRPRERRHRRRRSQNNGANVTNQSDHIETPRRAVAGDNSGHELTVPLGNESPETINESGRDGRSLDGGSTDEEAQIHSQRGS